MNVPLPWIAGLAAGALSLAGTWRALRVARATQTLAMPNERSSHTQPTPTGGGVGLGVAAVVVLTTVSLLTSIDALLLIASSVALACWCGWRDDLRPLSPAVKMAVLTVAALALVMSHSLEAVSVPAIGALSFGLFAVPLTLFWIAGFTNAFNFMDGIDGIAATTALVSGGAYAVLGVRAGDATLAVVGSVTAGGALGFLPWNFPKARIFMGDAGSLVLGLLLSFSAVLAQASDVLPFAASVLLLGPFVFDTSFTLLRRLLRGEKVWRAHREHLYQRLSRIWGTHPRVSMLYGGFSVVTAALALSYGSLPVPGQLLSLGVPFVAMLAFAALVLAADRRREARAAAAPD